MSNTFQIIVSDHLSSLSSLPYYKRKVFNDIALCRTPDAGYYVQQCTECDAQEIQFASCGSRYCNQCGHHKKEEWLYSRLEELLPVQYFMITTTVPSRLRVLFLLNERLCYNALFQANANAIKRAASYEHLSCHEIGFQSFLHTWKQDGGHHPHVHSIVPGGGLSEDEMEWKNCKQNWFEDGERIALLFRHELSNLLHSLYKKGRLKMPYSFPDFISDTQFLNYVRGPKKQKWNAHVEATKGSPEYALDYLGRYVHRTAISDERIESYDGQTVCIRVKDRETGGFSKVHIPALEFLTRFANHILPKGFSRSRSYGFMSCSQRRRKLSLIRSLLNVCRPPVSTRRLLEELDRTLSLFTKRTCSRCKKGHMEIVYQDFGKRMVKVSPHKALMTGTG